jgi:hypothetical protein
VKPAKDDMVLSFFFLQMFSLLLAYGWEQPLDLSGARIVNADAVFHSKSEIMRLMNLNAGEGKPLIRPAKGLEDGCVNMVCKEDKAGAYTNDT